MTGRGTLRIKATDRVMVLAVHPDDESLATGGLLRRAVAVGAAVRVLFVTDGENNPWPQRVLERRWRIGPGERARWGQRRRRESLAALARLGVPAVAARFLGWPDQGLTRLLLGATAGRANEAISSHVRAWRPTQLLVPSLADRHPDHNALAVLVRLALDQWVLGNTAGVPEILHYVVHGKAPAANLGVTLPLFVWEKHAKRAAISEHVSQLRLSRRRFLAYATDEERFVGSVGPRHDDDAVSPARCSPWALTAAPTLTWPLESPFRAFERPSLHFVFAPPPAAGGTVTAWTLPLGKTVGVRPILRARDGTPLGEAVVQVERRRITVRLPAGLRPPSPRVLVKLQRRRSFLDADGWHEFSLPTVHPSSPRARNVVSSVQPLPTR